ncbi:hypothetical protein ACM9XC_07305 [Xanthomonas sacchari]
MNDDILAIQAAVAGLIIFCVLLRAGIAFERWSERRFADQLEAEYRAFVMVEEAKREAARRA